MMVILGHVIVVMAGCSQVNLMNEMSFLLKNLGRTFPDRILKVGGHGAISLRANRLVEFQAGEQVETTWNITLNGGETFDAATLGAMPGINVSGQDTLLLGTSSGRVLRRC